MYIYIYVNPCLIDTDMSSVCVQHCHRQTLSGCAFDALSLGGREPFEPLVLACCGATNTDYDKNDKQNILCDTLMLISRSFIRRKEQE